MTKLEVMKFLIWKTELGSTADRAGIQASHKKKAAAETKEMMNGAINAADPHPSIGPLVRPRIKQMRNPIMKITPGKSSRFHLGDLSEERGALILGRRMKAPAEKTKQSIATIRKNQ